MRIVFVSHSSDVTGGAELCLLESTQALKRRHEVSVIVRRRGPLEARLLAQGTHTRHATYAYWLGKKSRLPVSKLRRTAGSLVGLPGMLWTARSLAPDVLISNTVAIGTGAIVARALNIPHVWYVHEFGDRDGALAFDFGFSTARALMNGSALVIATSDAIARHYAAAGVNAPMRVIPNAVSVTEPSKRLDRRAALELVVVGHVSTGKRQDDAVRALGLLRRCGVDARLTLLGTEDAGYGRRLRQRVQSEGLERFVEFAGFVSAPAEWIASSDVSISCSAEGFGRGTVEAMKLGCVVVGANRDATAELIDDGVTGLLYPPGEVQALAAKLSTLVDPELRARLASNARTFARDRFNLDRHGEALDAALSVVAREAGASRPVR